MAACLDIDSAVNGDIRLYILIPHSYVRKGAEDIDCGNCRGCFLYSFKLCRKEVPHFRKNIRFKGESLILSAQYGILGIFQLLCDEALGIGKGLLAYPAFGDKVVVGARYFKIVAEHAVEAYFQVLDACVFLFALLYLVNNAPAVVHYMSQLVKLLIEALLDDTAVLNGYGRLVHYGVLNKVHKLFKGGYLAVIACKEL